MRKVIKPLPLWSDDLELHLRHARWQRDTYRRECQRMHGIVMGLGFSLLMMAGCLVKVVLWP